MIVLKPCSQSVNSLFSTVNEYCSVTVMAKYESPGLSIAKSVKFVPKDETDSADNLSYKAA